VRNPLNMNKPIYSPGKQRLSPQTNIPYRNRYSQYISLTVEIKVYHVLGIITLNE
jgi:hypothetical protein